MKGFTDKSQQSRLRLISPSLYK